MPMTQPQRIALARLLSHDRADWHDAGIHSACAQLADQPGTAFELQTRAITAASIASHRTPECITWPTSAATKPTPTPAFTEPDPTVECPIHGPTVHRPDTGLHTCCWTARGDDQDQLCDDCTKQTGVRRLAGGTAGGTR